MKKAFVLLIAFVLAAIPALCHAENESPSLEIWAEFNDNQKALYSIFDEIEGEIECAFEYLGRLEMADGSREIVDLLFIVAAEAEDGLYVLDLEDGEFYDHINDKKVGEFKDREHVVNTLANSWVCGNTEFLWYDGEVKLYMSAEEIQDVLDAIPAEEPMRGLVEHPCSRCGEITKFPFTPRGDRPVYCSTCWKELRGE